MSLPGTSEEEEGARFRIIHFGRACVTATCTHAHTHGCPSLFMSILDQSNAQLSLTTHRATGVRARPRIHFQGRRKEDGVERGRYKRCIPVTNCTHSVRGKDGDQVCAFPLL